MKWQAMLEKVLLGSKYIWEPLPEKINQEELYGLDDQMGYLDHVTEFVSEVEKKAFMAGFAEGVATMLKEDETLDKPTNQITAERKYLEWRE